MSEYNRKAEALKPPHHFFLQGRPGDADAPVGHWRSSPHRPQAQTAISRLILLPFFGMGSALHLRFPIVSRPLPLFRPTFKLTNALNHSMPASTAFGLSSDGQPTA